MIMDVIGLSLDWDLPSRSPAHAMQRLDDEGREGDALLSMPIEKVC